MPKPTTSKASLPKVATLRPPAIIAIERLAKLAMASTTAPRMTAAATGIVADWRREQLSSSDLRERIETLLADVALGIEAAENYVGEAETDGQRKNAQGQVDGLTAVREALKGEKDRL